MINSIDKAGHRGWLLALAGVTTASLLALAGPVIAADEAPAAAPEKKVIIKMIKRGPDGKVEESSTISDGATLKMLEDCGVGKKFDSDTETKDANGDVRRTRVVLCSRGAPDQKASLEGLEAARKRIAEDTELNAEQRAKVLAALDAEITRAKGAQTQTP
jgi:hypothetical protein